LASGGRERHTSRHAGQRGRRSEASRLYELATTQIEALRCDLRRADIWSLLDEHWTPPLHPPCSYELVTAADRTRIPCSTLAARLESVPVDEGTCLIPEASCTGSADKEGAFVHFLKTCCAMSSTGERRARPRPQHTAARNECAPSMTCVRRCPLAIA